MLIAGHVLLSCKLTELHGSPLDQGEMLVLPMKANALQFDHLSNTC